MSGIPPRASNMRTGRQTSGLKTGALIAGTGTWNTHKLGKKNRGQVSSALKEDHLLTMLDTFTTGTNLSSELNTPEIKFEDFQFTDKVNSYNDSSMEVECSRDAFEHDVDCSNVENCLSPDTSTSVDPYTLFDMSPGSRDVLQVDQLQADQHEQRVNIQDFTYVTGGDVPTYESFITSTAIPELDLGLPQPQTISDTFSGNGLGAVALGQPQVLERPALCNTPPVLSISDDFDCIIPPDVLEQMDSLFPEEPMIPNNPPVNEVCSTELDMILGTHAMHNDLLFGALESSGLFDYGLGDFNVEENENELCTVDMKPIILTNNTPWQGSKTIVQPVNPLSGSSCFITKNPLEFLNDPKQESNDIVQPLNPLAGPSSFITKPLSFITKPLSFLNDPNTQDEMVIPTPSTSFSTTCPKTPSKKCPDTYPSKSFQVEMVTPTPSTPFSTTCPKTPSKKRPDTYPSKSFQVEMVTPTPSTSFSTTCPKTPSKKRPDTYEATPTGSTGSSKRQRRNSRKPLRFRETDDAFGGALQADLGNNELNIVEVTESVGNMLGNKTFVEVKEEESELSNITTADRKNNSQTTSQTNLTEEQKYHRIRILNNEASKRCRQKRKCTVKDMATDIQSLEERNKVLKKKHEDLVQLRDRFQTFVNDFFRQRLASSSN